MSNIFSDPTSVYIVKPSSACGWARIIVFIFSASLLEESFFRVYLRTRLAEYKPLGLILFSSALFALGHLHYGIWGMINAFLSGCVLCFILDKTKSFAGIVAAHGAYNILVIVLS